jgi:hypothetical protein
MLQFFFHRKFRQSFFSALTGAMSAFPTRSRTPTMSGPLMSFSMTPVSFAPLKIKMRAEI